MDYNEIIRKKIQFQKNALSQLNSEFDLTNTQSDNKELILSTYMSIFSYLFDDREPVKKTDTELDEIAKKCWRSDIANKTNEDVGKVYANEKKIKQLKKIKQERGSEAYSREVTKFVIENTRNAIQHGDFIVNEDGTIKVFDTKSLFELTFEFDCICDICDILKGKEEIKYYEDLLHKLKANQKQSLDSDTNKLLYFDLLSNILISYNEDYAHSHISNFNRLYSTNLTSSSLGHIRNSSTHHYRTISGNAINILDYKTKTKEEETSNNILDFSQILYIGKTFDFNKLEQLEHEFED